MMARFEFQLPDIGEGVTEAELVEWHVAPGDRVEEGQLLVSASTQKATVELEAPVSGVVRERHGKLGETVNVGSLLVVIETEASAPAPAPAQTTDQPIVARARPAAEPAQPPDAPPRCGPGKALAAPAVRERARMLGIDLATVPTAGGPVTHADLDRLLLAQARAPESATVPLPPGGEEVPLSSVRRQIARRMQRAKDRIPHFTYVDEVDITALEALRARLNAQAENPPVGLLPFLISATCRALPSFPDLNARFDDVRDILVRYSAIHLGLAVQTDKGLIVPVLHEPERMTLREIADAVALLARKAREGALSAEETAGSTFTFSSLGKLGGIAATPIVNWPEVAVLAAGRMVDRPVSRDGRVEIGKTLNLSISCDHRVIDGAVAAEFVRSVKCTLEQPDWIRRSPFSG
jgi:2-oxoisovalerate dehydrogenase E2 component (dihydrolipoyl transacylase)